MKNFRKIFLKAQKKIPKTSWVENPGNPGDRDGEIPKNSEKISENPDNPEIPGIRIFYLRDILGIR